MQLYNETCLACSKLITERYSTSFTLGIRTLAPRLRSPIYAIYGFVRAADEIVDTFLDSDRAFLLNQFREHTWQAIESGISCNPVLHSFQLVVKEYGIDREYIEAFLDSMAMDLESVSYTPQLYGTYIYGSAEVVGLMCLRVFCEGDKGQFEALKESARSLGAAFQKVNFLRDMKSDFKERGRTYFPGIDFSCFSDECKQKIETDIQRDFEAAYEGIVRLPTAARMGVYLAYKYYQKLFRKIKALPPARVQQERIRVPDNTKLALLVSSYLRYHLNAL